MSELTFLTRQDATGAWAQDREQWLERGLVLPSAREYVSESLKRSGTKSLQQIAMDMALDAQPALGTDPNGAIPAVLTTTVDPDVIRFVFAPLQMAKILGGEKKSGTWLDDTRIFSGVEETGEVSSYGDYINNGRAGVNFNYPQFQSYLFQAIIGYGERELERAGLMRINYVSELQTAVASILNRFGNLSYAFGISNLQNYGLINNPFLSAFISPAVKAWGGTSWFNGGSPAATANEVYNDILALVERLINQTNGALEMDSPMTLAMSPASQVAMKFANSFGVYVEDLLKKGFPGMKIKTAPQYGVVTSSNPQGASTAGNVLQLIADRIDGQQVAYPAFPEKLRAHKLVAELSAWKQKYTSGTWGVIMRMPVGVTGMIGI